MRLVPILTAGGIRKSYGGRAILRGAELALAEGTVVGLIGRNGAGKTTLLRILCGMVRCDEGEIRLNGSRVPAIGPRPGLVQFGGGHTIPPGIKAREWADLVSDGAWRSPEKRAVRDLSRGTRQMLGLRATLATRGARVIVLDEPWEGLDPDGARWLNVELARKAAAGVAILVSSHRLDDLARASQRYAFLSEGTIRERTREDGGPRIAGDDLLREFDRLNRMP